MDLGSLAVQVPVRVAKGEEVAAEPLATFESEGDACAIVVRGDTSSTEVSNAMRRAAQDAIRHFSRKLLN